jgi:hypothetical protein
MMNPITHSPTTERAAPIFETKQDVQVDVNEGDFAEACEICFVRPTAVYVELRRPDLDAAQKTGAIGQREPVERRYFCAEHICAADLVYRSY